MNAFAGKKAVRNRIGLSAGDRVFTGVNTGALIFILLLVLYPLVYIISCSFSVARGCYVRAGLALSGGCHFGGVVRRR